MLEVYEATREAAERARRGEGATLIEAKTMRMKGHAEHDDARYVPEEMLETWRKKDPIERFKKHLASKKLMSSTEKAGIEDRLDREIGEDIAFAEASPFPAAEDAARPVWA